MSVQVPGTEHAPGIVAAAYTTDPTTKKIPKIKEIPIFLNKTLVFIRNVIMIIIIYYNRTLGSNDNYPQYLKRIKTYN
jgi:hypothetical protein